MVKFRLVEETGERLLYWYYPEGRFDEDYGIISVNRGTGDADIIKVAEGDYEHDIPPEEINEMIIAINQMKEELGETDFDELETESIHSVEYGDHAVSRIREAFLKGEVLREGTVMWY